MALPEGYEIEIVRGEVDERVGEDLVRFWTTQGALADAEARARLREAVCVLRDEKGAVAGINSVYREDVELIGSRSFWVYRAFVPGAEDAEQAEMIAAAFEALNAEFVAGGGEGPIGLCVLIEDSAMADRHPEAVWPDVELLYAGYTPEGVQVRIRYFDGARV